MLGRVYIEGRARQENKKSTYSEVSKTRMTLSV
jgi:hypothetical protein